MTTREEYHRIAQKLIDIGYDLYSKINIQDQLLDAILRQLSAFKPAI